VYIGNHALGAKYKQFIRMKFKTSQEEKRKKARRKKLQQKQNNKTVSGVVVETV